MSLRGAIKRWWRTTWARLEPRRPLHVIEGDSLPALLKGRAIVVAREDGEDWCAGMRCPCGCGDVIELLLVAEANPRWDLTVDASGWPSLSPSVWRKRGCRSHFWLRGGAIQWCS